MQYQELNQRYGSHIAKRVQAELDFTEFRHIDLMELPAFLENRAVTAHKEYQANIDNPFSEKHEEKRAALNDRLLNRWRNAEYVSALVAMAEDVSEHLHVQAG
ncbi:MAG: hypothetical protein M3N08_01050 [Pseudomonadota bacterium]|nr:hypothetical protein [Pseudomonadota bacterium]